MNDHDNPPVIFRDPKTGIGVTRIPCEALTQKGQPCMRSAEYRQEDGRLVCHVHRFAR